MVICDSGLLFGPPCTRSVASVVFQPSAFYATGLCLHQVVLQFGDALVSDVADDVNDDQAGQTLQLFHEWRCRVTVDHQ